VVYQIASVPQAAKDPVMDKGSEKAKFGRAAKRERPLAWTR
jgi:hypothetical protein